MINLSFFFSIHISNFYLKILEFVNTSIMSTHIFSLIFLKHLNYFFLMVALVVPK